MKRFIAALIAALSVVTGSLIVSASPASALASNSVRYTANCGAPGTTFVSEAGIPGTGVGYITVEFYVTHTPTQPNVPRSYSRPGRISPGVTPEIRFTNKTNKWMTLNTVFYDFDTNQNTAYANGYGQPGQISLQPTTAAHGWDTFGLDWGRWSNPKKLTFYSSVYLNFDYDAGLFFGRTVYDDLNPHIASYWAYTKNDGTSVTSLPCSWSFNP